MARPDIVFILADDLGYNELSFMNASRHLATPALDSLARSGVTLKGYYVGPICSPTRSALMTGRYMIRLGTQSNVIYWDTPWGVSLRETFIGEHFQAAGYSTALFGKWHLGMFREAYTPIRRGFSEHMGYYQGCESAFTHVAACCSAGSPTSDQNFTCAAAPHGEDYRGYDWFRSGPAPNHNRSTPDLSALHTNSATLIREAAVDFIGRQRRDTPFFLYLPFQNVHKPYTCQGTFRARYKNVPTLTEAERTLFGYISELDEAVAHVVGALESAERYDSSLLVFSSDNGAPPAGEEVDHRRGAHPGWIARNYPFRGHKALLWEGGTRVPGFVSGGSPLLPDAARGTVSHKLMHVTDWLPTLTGLAGAARPPRDGKPLDGLDVWRSIIDPETPSPRNEMLYNINPLCGGGQAGAPTAAIRIGGFKLMAWCFRVRGIGGGNVTGPVPAPQAAAEADPEFKKGRGLVLYDLDKDPAETGNLAHAPAHGATVQKLLSRLEELASEMVEPQQWTPPYQGPAYECATCPRHPGGAGPMQPWLPWL